VRKYCVLYAALGVIISDRAATLVDLIHMQFVSVYHHRLSKLIIAYRPENLIGNYRLLLGRSRGTTGPLPDGFDAVLFVCVCFQYVTWH